MGGAGAGRAALDPRSTALLHVDGSPKDAPHVSTARQVIAVSVRALLIRPSVCVCVCVWKRNDDGDKGMSTQVLVHASVHISKADRDCLCENDE